MGSRAELRAAYDEYVRIADAAAFEWSARNLRAYYRARARLVSAALAALPDLLDDADEGEWYHSASYERLVRPLTEAWQRSTGLVNMMPDYGRMADFFVQAVAERARLGRQRLWGSDFEEWVEDWLVNGLDADSKPSSGATMRWLFCLDRDDPDKGYGSDCGCCLMDWREMREERKQWSTAGRQVCQCACHGRIQSLASWMRAAYERWLAEKAKEEPK